MKTCFGWVVTICVLSAGAMTGSAQVLDHLRALTVARLPVGDPSVTVTNAVGQPTDGPKDIAVADLDGDGNQDFAVSDKDGSVTVYFGKGDGTFSTPLHLRTWTNAPHDARGFSITNYVTNICTSVWTNSWMSNGVPQTNWSTVCVPGPTNIYTNVIMIADGTTGLRGLALADFTGDGLRDIAVASPGESLIYLLVNVSGRDFADAIEIPAWFGVRDLASGDFDGDGLTDLVAAGTTNGIAHYHSLGGGSFEVVTNLSDFATFEYDFPQPAFYLKAFRPVGATRDELAVGRAQGAPVQVLAAGSDGRLAVRATLSNVVVHALDVGSLLHDRNSGLLDLVSVNHSDDVLEIRGATFDSSRFDTNIASSISVPGRAHGVAIADLDNDGWNDLVVVLQRFDKVQVLHNDHGTFNVVSEVTVGAGPRELAVGDFTGDGRSDAAILNRVSSDVSVLLAHPTAFGFRTLDMLYPADGEVVALQVYDFNGDGRADVVQLHRAAGEMSVRLARADGSLSDPVFYDMGTMPSDVRSVDVNNDGILDILAVDLGGFVVVRLGTGDGTFGPQIRTSLKQYANGGWSGGQLFSLVAADFDGDGNVDIAAGYMDCRLGLFRGNGDGTFEHTHTHVLGYETHGMAAADFDGDGDIDLVATPWDGSLIIVNNQGDLLTTSYLDRTVLTNNQGNYGAWTVLLTDYNHDGDPDLLVDGSLGYSLYLGAPGLDFILTTNILPRTPAPPPTPGAPPPVNQPAVSPVVGDFNGDGIQDVIAACVGKNCVSVSLGKPGGGFEEPFYISVPSSQIIATGDLDGDGLPDLIGTGEVLWTALSSRAPSMAAPPPPEVARPRPGKALINEVLAANSSIPLVQDGGRKSDFVELFNGGGSPLPLLDWKLRLERTNSLGVLTTNEYRFPTNAIIDAGAHLVLVCSDNIRSVYHTGFNLPAEGGAVCLIRFDGKEADRVDYPAQDSDHAYARFQDGVNGFVITDKPTPGQPNVNTGLNPPDVSIDDVDLTTLQPNQPVRFFARATDDLGVVNVSVLWRRLDIPDDVSKRVILYDDAAHGDGGFQDGYFSGLLEEGLPAGAEIQFYLECTDLSGQVNTAPGNPQFVSGGQTPQMYTLAVGTARPALEISEVVASNLNGLQDESGRRPDWIEIRNCSTEAVQLAGIGLGQKFLGNSGRMTFTNGVTLTPGQHLVIYADGKPELGPLHAPFKLSSTGDQLVLEGVTDRGSRYLIDTLTFGPQGPDLALARLGCGGPWVHGVPTPRTANVAGPWRSLIQSNSFLLAYPTRAGSTYTVEFKDRLNAPTWTALTPQPGTGVEQTVQQPIVASRFYRVREQ